MSAIQIEYDRYCKLFREAGITPLSYDHWLIATRRKPMPRVSDVQFDRDTEFRDGWAAE